MHIPDGFLDTRTAVTAGVFAVLGLGFALRSVRRSFPPRRVPLIGLASAFVFAAQMLNFPVLGGTSGHLIGAVLTTVLLGPAAAVLVLSSVLILQCFLFQDGGLTALGANIFNMALVAPWLGYAVYGLVRRLSRDGLRGRLFATAFAAWCSTVAASIACAGQLALSRTSPWNVVFPAMANVHMLIGIGEALITTLVVGAIARARPELLDHAQSGLRPRYRDMAGYGLLLSIGLAVFVAPFACPWPDGLDRIAAALGLGHKAWEHAVLNASLPEYAVPGIKSAVTSTAMAGGIGTLVAFGLAYVLARLLTPRARVSGAGCEAQGRRP